MSNVALDTEARMNNFKTESTVATGEAASILTLELFVLARNTRQL